MEIQPDKYRIEELAQKWLDQELSTREAKEFELWFSQIDLNPVEVPRTPSTDEAQFEKDLFRKIKRKAAIYPKSKILWPSVAAASIVLLLGLAIFAFYQYRDLHKSSYVQGHSTIQPGRNRAMMKLASGQQIELDANRGWVSVQGNNIKYADGSIVASQLAGSDMNSNSLLITPRGGQYQMVLSDGTKVWLNAGSSLKFPIKFGKQRVVELQGEAYFQVFRDKNHPFVVKTSTQEIQVLGTHFNICSYADEKKAVTTLESGSVQVSLSEKPDEKIRIKPGEQAISARGSLEVKTANTQLAVAWKDNKFIFDHTSIEEIMKRVARWYDVDVVYQGPVPTELFGGTVSRFDSIEKVLSILELTGKVHFKIERRQIIVSQ
ncbi:FecR family protein [Pedobacter jeongneungensis]|uniref:FecR family protein n=1 Tax=Pedobacter jeongneungensis TaxID=947309 RepID=UPI0004694956|nr:FecR domain-containing protein [Pedobacter jeongneungensis]